MALLKDSNLLAQLAFLGLSAGIETSQFAHITSHDFFWGYEDKLFSLAVAYNPFSEKIPFTKFGVLIQVVTVIPNAHVVLRCEGCAECYCSFEGAYCL
jgi:hypothetical protein